MKSIAIYGLGPVAMTIARLLDIASLDYFFIARKSKRGLRLKAVIPNEGVDYLALETRDDLSFWSGKIQERQVYFLEDVEANKHADLSIEHLFLCCPHSSFGDVLKSFKAMAIQDIVLANSGLGRTAEIASYLPQASLSCFSNFFGAAKYQGETKVILKNIKKEVFFYTSSQNIKALFITLFDKAGVSLSFTQTALEAEFRNITLYAHPAFSASRVCLSYSLGLTKTKKYMYKAFPEGPVEPRQTFLYAQLAALIQEVLAYYGEKPFNVLSFLHDKNYKVLDCYLNREEVDSYPTLSTQEQGRLIFSRYIGLLVDSNSEPDEQGRYFDFSAVPVAKAIFKDSYVELPRILREDFYHLYVINELAHEFQSSNRASQNIVSEIESVIDELEESQKALVKSEVNRIKESAKRNSQLIIKRSRL